MDQSKIGRFIAYKRKELELTQVQLAGKLGVSDKSVSKWERGICLPDVSLYQDICKELGITINEFFAGEELEKTDIEIKSEETIMSIAQDGSNTKRKMKTRLLALGIIIAILAAGIIYTLNIINQKGYFLNNYVRGYSSSAESNTIKELISGPNSHVWLVQYGIDDSYKKCSVVVDRYHDGKLESSEAVLSTEYIDSDDRSGIAAVVFDTDRNEYRVAVSDGSGMMSINDMSITGEEGKMPDDLLAGSGTISEDPVEVRKGTDIPIAVCNLSSGDYVDGYTPDAVEEAYQEGFVDNDYTLLIKLRFE